MESDDDFEHFSAVEAESPSAHSHGRKLKRLKRAADVVSADPLTEQSNEDLSPADMPNSAGSGPTNSVESTEEEAEEPSDRLLLSGVENGIKDNATDFGSVPMESEKENELLRDLMLDSEDEEINMGEGLREGSMEPIIGAPDERWHDGDLVRPSDTKRKTNETEKKKRNDGMDDDTGRIRSTAVVNKRREEKVKNWLGLCLVACYNCLDWVKFKSFQVQMIAAIRYFFFGLCSTQIIMINWHFMNGRCCYVLLFRASPTCIYLRGREVWMEYKDPVQGRRRFAFMFQFVKIALHPIEQERRGRIQQLHADSQRVLRGKFLTYICRYINEKEFLTWMTFYGHVTLQTPGMHHLSQYRWFVSRSLLFWRRFDRGSWRSQRS